MEELFEIWKPVIKTGGQLWKFQRGSNVSKYVKNAHHSHKDFQSYTPGQFIFTVFYSVGHLCCPDLCLDDEEVGFLV